MSKNAVSIQQVKLACRHVEELMNAGVTENLAIRTLELFTNTYAKMRVVGKASVDHASEYELWSRAALRAKAANPKLPYGFYLRVEHGTPKRQFARLVLDGYKRRKLTERWMNALCKKRWEVAVITIEENDRLNKVSRSKLFNTPRERWASVKIRF